MIRSRALSIFLLAAFGGVILVETFLPVRVPVLNRPSDTAHSVLMDPFAGSAELIQKKEQLITDLLFPRKQASSGTAGTEPPVVAARGDWRAYLDVEQTGLVYYYNVQTGISQWKVPDNFPTTVRLTSAERRLALTLQKAYYRQYRRVNNSNNRVPTTLQAASVRTPVHAFLSPDRMVSMWHDVVKDLQNTAASAFAALQEQQPWAAVVVPSTTSNRVSLSAAGTAAIATTPDDNDSYTADELLASHGNWQAYFDGTDSCLVYYFNVRTGASQWEPPAGFSAPRLTAAQYAQTTARFFHRMHVRPY